MKNKNKLLGLAAAMVFGGLFAMPAANAAATIIIVNGNAAGVGFNDTTLVAPVGGNPGTTLGQQRLNAFQFVANKWGSELNSDVAIWVLATFEPLSCTATSAVLGSAGAVQVFRDFGVGEVPGHWYARALANKLVGEDLDETSFDIRARFNSNLGAAGCLTGVPWYLGFDNNHGSSVDLVTVLTHEFGHGLGFQTFTNGSTGAYLAGFPSIWDKYLNDESLALHWDEMTDAQRAASSLNSGRLVWTGGLVTAAAPGVLSLGVPAARISGTAAGAATGQYGVGTASFGALLNTTGVSGDVMPTSQRGTVGGDGCAPFSAIDRMAAAGNIVIIDRGTCGFAVKAKNAQDAGAKGVIIHNNAPGGPAPGLGGSDPTLTIPTVSVTQADGNVIRASLTKRSRTKSGVTATLLNDSSQLAGASKAGFVQMYAPNPFQSGSSVSHYDVGAFPNLLMEPAINGDLTHEVKPPADLTLTLFQDIGW
jgi:hypothetical protein